MSPWRESECEREGFVPDPIDDDDDNNGLIMNLLKREVPERNLIICFYL